MKGMKRKLAGLMAVCMMLTSIIPSFAETISMDEIPVIDSIEVVGEVEQVSTTEVGSYDEVSEEVSVYGEATPSVPGAGKKVEYNGKNWMKYIPDNTRLGKLSIPGTHDSGTYDIHFKDVDYLMTTLAVVIKEKIHNEFLGTVLSAIEVLVVAALKSAVEDIVTFIQVNSGQCQDLSIQEQLDAGVRALDLRFRYDGGQWNIYHGCDDSGSLESIFKTCYCYNGSGKQLTLTECFETIQKFLRENPTEVVFLNIQDEGGLYNEAVEKELLALEQKYGFCCANTNREKSKAVLQKYYPNEKVPSEQQITSKTTSPTLGYYRGKAVDITGTLGKTSEWDTTKEKAVETFEGAFGLCVVFNNPYLHEFQTNVMVKLYKLNDPYGECSMPCNILYNRSLIIPIPIAFLIDITHMIVTPRHQAAYVNPRVCSIIDEYATSNENMGTITAGTGIMTMDFQTEEMCYHIARTSRRLVNGPEFTYKGKPGVGPETDPEEEEEIITVDLNIPEETIRELIRKYSSSNDSDDDDEPLFTGTWTNSVKGGSWSQDSNGIWHYTSTEKFKNTWGYIQNPYAKEGQNTADWFWFDIHGNMLTGWQFINGKWYYLNPNNDGTYGACLIGPAITPDGYEVDASGAWTGR